MRNRFLAAILVCAAPAVARQADSTGSNDVPETLARIRRAAFDQSHVMDLAGYLTDVAGPRLTGSANLKRAEEWARDQLRQWGAANAHLEAWGPFGRGWSLEGFSASMVAPEFSPLIAFPRAWSPGTNGTVRAEAILFDVKTPADLDRYRGKLKGKIVLFSPPRAVDPLFEPPARRLSDEDLHRLSEAPAPSPRQPFQFAPEQRASEELNYRKWQLVANEGAAAVLQPSARDAGTVYVTAATVPYPPDVPFDQRIPPWSAKPPASMPRIPQINVAAEQYNRMARLAGRGIPVEVELTVDTRFHDDDPMAYNVIAEIPGSDLRGEVVMFGGCIDSWHAATGATDNAAGAATALEIMRILQSLGVKPRRTIRIGLWSGEEQGELGSRAYVAAHMGRARPERDKLDAYFNFDWGTGRIRGLYLQGNRAALPMFRELFDPLRDLGASTLSLAAIDAGDHAAFDAAGVPGFQWIRDYMEGSNTRAAHTNMDTYDHLLEDDLKQSAAVGASIVYELAMRDGRAPRKSGD